MNPCVVLVVHLSVMAAAPPADAGWPQWRGPDRRGVWHGVALPGSLDARHVKQLWRREIGGGYSGIAVSGGKVFTMERQDLAARGENERSVERLICLEAGTGKPLWSHEYAVDYGDMDHANGPRATPTIDGGQVFSIGALGHLFCVELESGKVLWSVDTASRYKARLPIWGQAASPLVDAKRVYVQIGAAGEDGKGGTLVALERQSGKEVWKALDDRPGYSSPIFRDARGRREIVFWTADSVVGVDPGTGSLIWRTPFRTSNYDVAIISPVLEGDRLFVSGYWDGTRVVDLGEAAGPRLVWESRVPSCLMATPLSRDGYLYALDRREGLLCIDWNSGRVLWNDGHRMTPKGRNPHASMVWAGDRAVILNALGELILARLSPRGYDELGRAAIIGRTWAHPAFAGQDVFARSDDEIVCVRIGVLDDDQEAQQKGK